MGRGCAVRASRGAALAASCGMPRFLRTSRARNACAVRGAGAWGHAALCNLPRFLRPSGRSQRLRGGALGRGGHAAFCNLPRFLRPSGRSQRLRGGVRWGVGDMPRFAACRVSCGLWAARNACAVRGAGAWGDMPRFAACRVSCGLWAARNACGGVGCGGRAVHAALCSMPRFLRPLGRSQRLRLLCCGTGIWGAAQTPAGAQGSVCPVGTWAEGPKRPEAGQRNHERDPSGKRE